MTDRPAAGRVQRALTRVAMAGALAVIATGSLAALHLSRLDTSTAAAAAPRTVPVVSAEGTPGPAGTAGEPATGAPAGSAGLRADPAWLERVAAATGIPARALAAYAAADLTVDAEQPGCGIGWNTLAGIGSIESDHGRHGGAVLGADGYPDPAIRGIALDGTQSAAISDTDGGVWDGDTVWDRAVGPMQFIPDTWSRWGADGDGDGAANPNQIDDAALAAARYLCASGAMTSTEGWRAAIFSYNHLDTYVDDVAATANRYAELAGP